MTNTTIAQVYYNELNRANGLERLQENVHSNAVEAVVEKEADITMYTFADGSRLVTSNNGNMVLGE
tara:strand:+ start:159 stop:356 length:198 start_codon:yes stop_codon:yes gene_type:complete